VPVSSPAANDVATSRSVYADAGRIKSGPLLRVMLTAVETSVASIASAGYGCTINIDAADLSGRGYSPFVVNADEEQKLFL